VKLRIQIVRVRGIVLDMGDVRSAKHIIENVGTVLVVGSRMEIKVVIFDLWKTLVYKDLRNGTIDVIRREFNLKGSREVLRKKFEMALQTRKWKDKYSAYEFLCKKMGIDACEQNVNTVLGIRDKREKRARLYSHSLPLIKKLKQDGYKIALLSNTSIFSVEYLRKNTSLLNSIDYTMFSFEDGEVKPSLKGFKKIMKRYGVKPDEVLMIGDSLVDDIRPAKKLGINTIRFENPRQLKRELKRFGIDF